MQHICITVPVVLTVMSLSWEEKKEEPKDADTDKDVSLPTLHRTTVELSHKIVSGHNKSETQRKYLGMTKELQFMSIELGGITKLES